MYTGAAGIYANRAANSSLRGTNLTSISCPCAPIMKQTLPEKQPSAINQEQRGINAEWGTNGGRGGGEFSFSHARGGWTRNSTRFFSPPRHQQFPVERDEKNSARIRITRQTTAQLKLRSRDQRKRNANQRKKKKKRAETRISCPILPSPSTVTWERALKNFFFAETSPRTCNTPRRHPSAFFFFFSAHTRKPRIFQTRVVCIHVHAQRVIHVGREREKKSGSVLVGSRPSGREAAKQPASRLADQPTIPHSIRRFSLSLPRHVMKSVPAF